MPARQVRDVVHEIRRVHRLLAGHFRDLAASTRDDQFRVLLTDIEAREKHFADCLSNFEEDADEDALGTWIQFVPEAAVATADLSERLQDAPPSDCLEDAVQEIQMIDRALGDAYRELADQSDCDKIRELFQNLAKLADNNDHHYSNMLLN